MINKEQEINKMLSQYLNDKKDRLKWYYMHLHDMYEAQKKDDLRDEWFFELFEEIYTAGHHWIPGIPEKRYANLLLKIKQKDSKYEHIVKAFYAEKCQIDAYDPDGEYDPNVFDMGEDEEYYLVEGFYEDAQWYNDETRYYKIPEKDIVAWQPLSEV